MAIPQVGFVIRIKRDRVENKGSGSAKRYRTVGAYECFFDGQPINDPQLRGAAAEPNGPGDNTETGKKYGRRIEAGTYPLRTHLGPRYETFKYDQDGKKPAILVGSTNKREAVLIHPGHDFKASIGCINLTGSLTGPNDNISPTASRTRLIAFIDAMKTRLGNRFPTTQPKKITDAWLVIEGEP